MVRVANRGITTVIDARGAFSEALDFDDRGALDLRVPPPLPPTFYAAYGEVSNFFNFTFCDLSMADHELPEKFIDAVKAGLLGSPSCNGFLAQLTFYWSTPHGKIKLYFYFRICIGRTP